MRSIAAALFAAAAILAPTAGVGAGESSSGLRGVVMRAPIRPVCAVDEPCSAPAKNTLLEFVRAGRRSVMTRTDGEGHYRVTLAPGAWTVRVPNAPRIGSGIAPKLVRVVAGRFRVVDFSIDTGIR